MHLATDVIDNLRSLLENGAGIEAENVDGLRPIHWALRTGFVELVELLIQHVDAADAFGNRPLHEAACHGLSVVQLLVHHGTKVNIQNIDGKTPLHVANAIEREHSDVAVFLLKAGANVGLTHVWSNRLLHYIILLLGNCSVVNTNVITQTRMWANAQPDGRPAEYR